MALRLLRRTTQVVVGLGPLTLGAAAAVIGLTGFSPAAMAATYVVKLGSDRGLLVFEPKQLTIKPGDTIQWVLNTVPPHNVVFDPTKNPTSDAALAKSLSHTQLLMNRGQKVETTFPADAPAGQYHFYCQPHRAAGMTGVITVAP